MSRQRRRWLLMGFTALICGALWLCSGGSIAVEEVTAPSEGGEMVQVPVRQTPTAEYLPVASWSGRLILPDRAAAEADPGDWVWMDVYTSPNPELVGQRVRLQWQVTDAIQDFVELVTRGITFDEEAIASIEQGRVHPTRLNGWSQVGPLQSLAGTRTADTVIVALPKTGVKWDEAASAIALNAVPIQIPERFYGLVKVLGPDNAYPAAEDCPGEAPCPSQWQRVQHYNPATQTFDGRIETVYWPQVSPRPDGVFQSTTIGLANSPAGAAGWYIYGAQRQDGRFSVRAIAPRRLFQLEPQQVITGSRAALNYINFGNWRDTAEQKGTLQSVLVTPQAEANAADWQMGDRLLVIHLFGGIGGEKAEPRSVPGTVTGHYAYGIGQVVPDPFTQEPRLQVIYDQVYSHNPLGIVAGRVLWAEYMGSLTRGWLGTRPVSDVLVKIPALSQIYQFGDITLNPFAEFQRELVVMMARYRTGDGTGAAIVTPAQSCVQDSSQALYETIRKIRVEVATHPAVRDWLDSHPDDLQTQLFRELISLGRSLRRQLVPLGMVRPDWKENAEVLSGIASDDRELDNATTPLNNLLSWRTVIPRVAYDNVAAILLNHSSEMWFLRTNQVGGQDPTIAPLPPTELFGEYVVIPTAFSRLIESLRWPRWRDLSILLLGFVAFAIALQVFANRLPTPQAPVLDSRPLTASHVLRGILAPALWQELVFRVLLLPHPTEAVRLVTGVIWVGTSLGLFVLLRVVQSRMRPRSHFSGGLPELYHSFWLGAIATVIYLSTGALWAVTSFHWGSWLWQQMTISHKRSASL